MSELVSAVAQSLLLQIVCTELACWIQSFNKFKLWSTFDEDDNDEEEKNLHGMECSVCHVGQLIHLQPKKKKKSFSGPHELRAVTKRKGLGTV